MVLPFHICGVISLVAGDDKKGLKALKIFYKNNRLNLWILRIGPTLTKYSDNVGFINVSVFSMYEIEDLIRLTFWYTRLSRA